MAAREKASRHLGAHKLSWRQRRVQSLQTPHGEPPNAHTNTLRKKADCTIECW